MIPREEIVKITEYLQSHFPKAFPVEGIVVLKKGINKDIHEKGVLSIINISQTKLKRFLALYTKSFRYLKAFNAGAHRYDLEGNITGQVTLEECNHAKSIISSRSNRNKQEREKPPIQKKEEPPVIIKQEKSSTDNQEDLNNTKSKYTGTLKLKFPISSS